MDDESTTAPVEDEAPVTEAAPAETGAPATPPDDGFEKRYNDLRTEFNQRNNLIDRARQGDAEAAEALGFQLYAEEQETDQEDEELEGLQDPRVDAILQERAQERETAILSDVQGHIDVLLDKANIELPQRLRQAILSEAWLRGGGAQIQPDTTETVVKEWVDEYKALEKAAGDRYVASKKAPHVSKVGTGATEEVLPLDATHAQRVAFMKERLASEEQ